MVKPLRCNINLHKFGQWQLEGKWRMNRATPDGMVTHLMVKTCELCGYQKSKWENHYSPFLAG